MASTLTRRPLPAVIGLLALLLLTGLVWWRVLHRGGSGTSGSACPTPTPTPSVQVLPAPSTITVKVLNATSRAGIAAKARSALVADGFAVPQAAGNDSGTVKIPGVAEIRFGPAGRKGATLLRYYFPGATLVPSTAKDAVVVVSLGNTYKSVAPPAVVAAAMKSDDVVAASPSPSPSASGSSVSC